MNKNSTKSICIIENNEPRDNVVALENAHNNQSNNATTSATISSAAASAPSVSVNATSGSKRSISLHKFSLTSSLDELIVHKQPTLSERLTRYMMVVIYLGGLSMLGFLLSIYYIYFWDSRQPPAYVIPKKTIMPLKL